MSDKGLLKTRRRRCNLVERRFGGCVRGYRKSYGWVPTYTIPMCTTYAFVPWSGSSFAMHGIGKASLPMASVALPMKLGLI